jgi:hypothetical protein
MIGRPLSVHHIDLWTRFHLLQRGLLPGGAPNACR